MHGTYSALARDCHWSDVAALTADVDVPAYSVAFDQRFPRHLLRLAADDDAWLVVGDRRFGPVFMRLLRQIAGRAVDMRRIRVVEAEAAEAELTRAPRGTWVYVCPTVVGNEALRLPAHVRCIEGDWHVAPASIEALRAGLAIERMPIRP